MYFSYADFADALLESISIALTSIFSALAGIRPGTADCPAAWITLSAKATRVRLQ